MRALPSGEVAISTARRRLSCRTGRSAAASAETARRIEQSRGLNIFCSRDGRAETRRRKADQASDGSFRVGGIAEAVREHLNVLSAQQGVGHCARREMHSPKKLGGGQIWRGVLKGPGKAVDDYSEMILEGVRKKRFLVRQNAAEEPAEGLATGSIDAHADRRRKKGFEDGL